MQTIHFRRRRPFIAVFFIILILTISAAGEALCQSRPSFSFCVFGDTQDWPFLPGREADAKSIQTVLDWRFHGRATPEFDPDTGLVKSVHIAPKDDMPEATIHYRDGIAYLMTVGSGPDRLVIMRRSARLWIFRRVLDQIRKGAVNPAMGASFAIQTGDMIYWDKQGSGFAENEFYQDVYDHFISLLTPPDPKTGLVSRIWPVIGNHEVWGDNAAVAFLEVFPQLKEVGVTREKRDYSFAYNGCRFIFLDSGGYEEGGNGWAPSRPPFEEQMKDLENWLRQAVEEKADHVFITYHKPSYSGYSRGTLRPDRNPNRIIEPFAKNLDITVMSGHIHSTEAYLINGVRYLVIGAGGAPQILGKPDVTTHKELYWNGQRRVEDYNFFKITVDGPNLTFKVHRFRPDQTERPLEVVELFR